MTTAAPTIAGIAGLRRPVVDLQRSVDFYRGALGFDRVDAEPAAAGSRQQRMRLGSQWIELVEVAASRMTVPAVAPDPRFQHAAIVAGDIDAAYRRLTDFAPTPFAPITTGGPQRLPAASGGATAFKFRDPDGHPLELIAFAPGAASPRWARDTRSLTLGIDHFAIVVADAERSIAFYEARGFRLRHRQVNEGVEQGRLDGLATAVVEVVALAMPSAPTPHLELLCYRQPRAHATTSLGVAFARDVIALVASPADPGSADFADPDGHAFGDVMSAVDQSQPPLKPARRRPTWIAGQRLVRRQTKPLR